MSAVMHRALREAIRLGHPSAGAVHVVLALLDEDHPSLARDVLVEHGLDRAHVQALADRQYRHRGAGAPPGGGATAGPLWHETAGRAQGLAAALGADDPELVLLALLWQPGDRWFADVLASAQTSREAVVATLGSRRAPVPPGPPPPLPPPKTQAAAFPKGRANDVNWALRAHSPGLHWGIGSDPDDEGTNVVLAAADVDLAAVLDEVVGAGAWRWRRRAGEAEAR